MELSGWFPRGSGTEFGSAVLGEPSVFELFFFFFFFFFFLVDRTTGII